MHLRQGLRVFVVCAALAGSTGAGPSEDSLPPGVLARLGTTRLRHDRHHVSSVTFSPDGRSLASGGADGFIRLWDPTTGRQTKAFQVGSTVLQLLFAADGKTLACHEEAGSITLWRIDRAKRLGCYPSGSNPFWLLGFTPDGKLACFDGPKAAVRFLDAVTGKELHRLGLAKETRALALAPDGKTVVSAAADVLILRAVKTGRELCRFACDGDWMERAAVSANGRVLAAAAPRGKEACSHGKDYAVRVWDLRTGKDLYCRRGGCPPASLVLAISADGKRLVAGGQRLSVWDTDSGKLLRRHTDFDGDWAVAISPDGKTIAAGGSRSAVGLWDAHTGAEVVPLPGHQAEVSSLAFSPDGRLLASASYADDSKHACLWDLATRREIGPLQGAKGSGDHLAFSPDGKVLAVQRDTTLHLWETATHKPLRQFVGPKRLSPYQFFPDSKSLIGIRKEDSVGVWEAATGKLLRTFGKVNRGVIEELALSPDGKVVAVALDDFTVGDLPNWKVNLWGTRKGAYLGQMVLPPREGGEFPLRRRLLFLTRGRLLAVGCVDSALQFRDYRSGTVVARVQGVGDYLNALLLSHDGRLVLAASPQPANKGMIVTLVESVSCKVRGRIKLPATAVWSLALSPDGKVLATGCANGTILLWDFHALVRQAAADQRAAR